MTAPTSSLFRMVSYRHGRGSMLITTNKAVKDWPEILAGDEAMATVLLDRLLHRCHVLSVKGRDRAGEFDEAVVVTNEAPLLSEVTRRGWRRSSGSEPVPLIQQTLGTDAVPR